MDTENTLAIEDNGIGMNQEQFDQYSQPYTRGSSDDKGTGLGLNICVSIIEEHGFTIAAEKLEQGTKITIQLK